MNQKIVKRLRKAARNMPGFTKGKFRRIKKLYKRVSWNDRNKLIERMVSLSYLPELT